MGNYKVDNNTSIFGSQNMSVSESKSGRSKKVQIEFKRYEASQDILETYIVFIPERQEKIIQFFNMIKPLVEGCNFKSELDNCKYKLELIPNNLTMLKISSNN